MKNLKYLYTFLTMAVLAIVFMSFVPSTNGNSTTNNNTNELLTPNPPSSGLTVGWKTVEVDERASGNVNVFFSKIGKSALILDY